MELESAPLKDDFQGRETALFIDVPLPCDVFGVCNPLSTSAPEIKPTVSSAMRSSNRPQAGPGEGEGTHHIKAAPWGSQKEHANLGEPVNR